MKIIIRLKTVLMVFLLLFALNFSSAQNCMPPHISFSIEKNAFDVFEVYLQTDKVYNPPQNLVSSPVLGITFPTGFSWDGEIDDFLNLTNQGNGNWTLGSLSVAPSCSDQTDYLFATLNSSTTSAIELNVINTPVLLFTFELPPDEPCEGDIALIENDDVFVTTSGCDGSINASLYIAVLGEGLCNNFLENIDNNGIDCSLAPLPVELLHFRASAVDKVSQLDWATASEINNRGFEIQRSTDGSDWITLGFVEGNGTTTFQHQYRFIDEAPLETNYYRLKQMDYNGTYSYSPLRTVSFIINLKRASIYPNPTSGELNLQLPEFTPGKVVFQVLDLNQKVVHERILENCEINAHRFNLSDLAPSVYMLKVRYPKAEEFIPFVLIND